MDANQVRAVSAQLTPAAEQLVRLLATAQVGINPANLQPWYDRSKGQFCWGRFDDEPGLAIVRFGMPVERAGSGWVRTLGEPQMTAADPVEAVRRQWPNDSVAPIDVTLDRSVSIAEGVQSVAADTATWNSSWGVGTSAKVTMGTKATAGLKAGPLSGGAEVSSSLELAINANYGGSSGGQHSASETTSRTTTSTRRVQQSFTVPPMTAFTATATYSQEQWLIPYVDVLSVDVPFELPPVRLRYATYFGSGHGERYPAAMTFQAPSLARWLDGFFGAPPDGCSVFAPGLDLTFTRCARDVDITGQVRALLEGLSIQRTGAACWRHASGFEMKTHSEPISC